MSSEDLGLRCLGKAIVGALGPAFIISLWCVF